MTIDRLIDKNHPICCLPPKAQRRWRSDDQSSPSHDWHATIKSCPSYIDGDTRWLVSCLMLCDYGREIIVASSRWQRRGWGVSIMADGWIGIGMRVLCMPMHEAGLLGGCVHIRCRMARDGSSGIRKMQENTIAWVCLVHEAFKGWEKMPKKLTRGHMMVPKAGKKCGKTVCMHENHYSVALDARGFPTANLCGFWPSVWPLYLNLLTSHQCSKSPCSMMRMHNQLNSVIYVQGKLKLKQKYGTRFG